MHQFDSFIKRRAKALGLFNKVINKLSQIEKEFRRSIDDTSKEIEEAQKLIEDKNSELAFLNAELAKTEQSRTSVQSFINPAQTA